MNSTNTFSLSELELRTAEVLLKYYLAETDISPFYLIMRDDLVKLLSTKIYFEDEIIYVALVCVMSNVLAKEYYYSNQLKLADKKLIPILNMTKKITENDLALIKYADYYDLPEGCKNINYYAITLSQTMTYLESLRGIETRILELDENLFCILKHFKSLYNLLELLGHCNKIKNKYSATIHKMSELYYEVLSKNEVIRDMFQTKKILLNSKLKIRWINFSIFSDSKTWESLFEDRFSICLMERI